MDKEDMVCKRKYGGSTMELEHQLILVSTAVLE